MSEEMRASFKRARDYSGYSMMAQWAGSYGGKLMDDLAALQTRLATAEAWESVAHHLAGQISHQGCTCTFTGPGCCGYTEYEALVAALAKAAPAQGPQS